MDDRISEVLRASQHHPSAPPVPTAGELEQRVWSRQRRDATLAGLAGIAALAVFAVGWPEPESGPSPVVRDAAVAEALGEVIDDLDQLAQVHDDPLPGELAVALLDPYAHAGDTGLFLDPLTTEGEL